MASSIFVNPSTLFLRSTPPTKLNIRFTPPLASLSISQPVKQEPSHLKIKCGLPLKCNPQLDYARHEAHTWFRRYINSPELESADIPFLIMSIMFLGDLQGVINFAKFFLFLVPLDDVMDNFGEESLTREEISRHIIDVMNGKDSKLQLKTFPLLQGWNDLCHEIRQVATHLQWKHFVHGMTVYLQGLDEQDQLQFFPSSPCPTLSTYLNIRRKVIGGFPAFPLEHVALGLEIEDDLWNDKAFQKVHNLIQDHMVFTNDLVSFEEDEGVIWNVVSIIKKTANCSLEKAIALSCQKAEEIEKEFQSELHKFKFLSRDKPLLLTYLDILAAHIPGHLKWLSHSSKYGHRKCRVILSKDNTPTLTLNYTA